MSRRVVIYTRVSTEEQAVGGVGLEAQHEAIMSWVKANLPAWHSYLFSDEGISGKDIKNRPGFQAAVEEACEQKGILIVYSYSRASRSVVDLHLLLEKLNKAGADFVSVTEHTDTTTPSGRLFFGVMALQAQFERELTVERTKLALALKKSKGERIGGIPYGKQLAADRVHFEDNEDEIDTRDYIRDLRETGCSLRGIQEVLRIEEIPNRAGKFKWRLSTIAKLCKGVES